jgi:hypothetical protein
MTMPTEPDKAEDVLEVILDKHAEYYIRETMKFFQEGGQSPALSRNNEGDLVAKAAIERHYLPRAEVAATLPRKHIPLKDMPELRAKMSDEVAERYDLIVTTHNQAIDDIRRRLGLDGASNEGE